MKKIIEYLKRFRDLKPPEQIIEKEAKEIIKNKLGVSELNYKLEFKKPNLIIFSGDFSFKSEVFLNKNYILEKLENKFKESSPTKILFKAQ